MISNSTLTPKYINFTADKKAIGGAAFQPANENLKKDDPHAAHDHILRLNPLQKFGLGVKKVTVDIPKSIVHGLQGDRNVSFHDFLQMALVPYYLGGAMLYNCFRAGGDVNTAKKQGVGVVLYYTGMALGNKFIDSFVKHKYGIDLNLAYKKLDGSVHKVFESADFTRWDLLEQKDWDQIGDKLGIPKDVVDRDTVIKEEVAKILVRARAWKLVLGATFAATGAGFIARNKAWEGLFANKEALKTTFKNVISGNNKPFMGRLKDFGAKLGSVIKSEIGEPFSKAIKEMTKYKAGKIALGAVIILPLLALINLYKSNNKKKVFLTKAEAMPYAARIENDPQLRNQLHAQINPNKINYEALYSQLANQTRTQAVQQQTRPSVLASPFDAFEAFMKLGMGG